VRSLQYCNRRWTTHVCLAAAPIQVAQLIREHHASTPLAAPQSHSPCWFSAVISANRAFKSMVAARRATIAPLITPSTKAVGAE